jgi:SAM-dependent methyltransferase
MAENDRDKLKWTFDRAAELYDKARPDYPEQTFEDLFALGGLERGAAVLELGCGTGKATRHLAQRGCRVVCIEIGENLAAVARRNLGPFPLVEVITSPFESWEPRESRFDMVFAATSWHWLDPDVRYEKAAHVLRPAGVLAILDGGGHACPDGFDPFFTEIQKCYEAIGEPHLDWPPPRPDQVPDRRKEIERSGLFEIVGIKRHVWSIDYTADTYIDVLNTYSGHIAWEQWRRDKLYAEVRRLIGQRPEGRIRKHHVDILHVCRRIS